MNPDSLKKLLSRLSQGEITIDETFERLKSLSFEDVGFACIDHHRSLRRGLSEVIFGEGKEVYEIITIMERMITQDEDVLVTRLSYEKAVAIEKQFPEITYYRRSKVLTLTKKPPEPGGRGTILVISAGTSDIPVAEEAAVTARFMGNRVDSIYDVGVAGLHRIVAHRDKLTDAAVIVVAAGMEGALPSVVAGLVGSPVIAVPTSIGYGASFNGISALLGMLNSCAAGVTVVNIDNGFGAGYAASLINKA
jgi:NCAIR mutase (PurE)-related protein